MATLTPPAAAFSIQPLGPFSLAAAARFWSGFPPAAHTGLGGDHHLHLAFSVEGAWTPIGVCLREVDGQIVGQAYGDVEAEVAERQTARILSLNVDGRGFMEVGQRDPVVADLQRRQPGLRPVCFYSPYEAAVWAILSQRIQMRQAAHLKDRLRETFGELVDIHGQPLRALPSPETLLGIQTFPGLIGSKVPSLHAVARAALEGQLDAACLRSLSDDEALRHLQSLPGVGPFSAELILLRGAGHPDYLTLLEPRFRHAVASAYGLDQLPSDDDLRHLSDRWRPYRMWVTFLLHQSSVNRRET
jgi:DNA-3-methyladenine glycosylase II